MHCMARSGLPPNQPGGCAARHITLSSAWSYSKSAHQSSHRKELHLHIGEEEASHVALTPVAVHTGVCGGVPKGAMPVQRALMSPYCARFALVRALLWQYAGQHGYCSFGLKHREVAQASSTVYIDRTEPQTRWTPRDVWGGRSGCTSTWSGSPPICTSLPGNCTMLVNLNMCCMSLLQLARRWPHTPTRSAYGAPCRSKRAYMSSSAAVGGALGGTAASAASKCGARTATAPRSSASAASAASRTTAARSAPVYLPRLPRRSCAALQPP